MEPLPAQSRRGAGLAHLLAGMDDGPAMEIGGGDSACGIRHGME
jgi:hypothetical protein